MTEPTMSMLQMLQEDLKNERMHCLFYQQAAVLVQGLHREELRELFLKEAQSELVHVDEFANLIVQLGGVPETEVNPLPSMCSCPITLCLLAQKIEQQVADIYAHRLVTDPECDCAASLAYFHLFYEDQIMDSQKAAWEFKLLSQTYAH